MKLLKLYLKGFTGIKKGMGIDEIELDLSNISGLVALSGDNGMGKTSIMDNLHPFRTLPSRKGALQYHVFLRDSVKDLTFLLDGHKYQTLIKIDAQSEKQEGFIYKDDSAHSETSGKVREYDEYIKNLFGSSELFFNSIFCAQNSEKISDLTTGELKKLFSEFLRLDKLIAHEDTAKQCVSILNEKIEAIDKEILLLAEKVQDKENLRKEVAASENIIAGEQTKLKAVESEIKKVNSELEEARQKKNKSEMIVQRIKDIEGGRERIKKEIESDKIESENELCGLRTTGMEILAELKTVNSILESEEKIKSASKDLKQIDVDLEKALKDQTRGNKNRDEALGKQRKLQGEMMANAVVDALKPKRGKIKEIENKINACQDCINVEYPRQMAALKNDTTLMLLVQDKENCEKQIQPLNADDLNCPVENPECKYAAGAVLAKEQLPEIEKSIDGRIEEIGKQRTEIQLAIDEKTDELKDFTLTLSKTNILFDKMKNENMQTSVNLREQSNVLDGIALEIADRQSVLEKTIASLTAQKEDAAILADKLSSIEFSRSQKTNLEKQKAENFEKGIAIKKKWDGRINGKELELTNINTQLEPLKTDMAAASEVALTIAHKELSIGNREDEVKRMTDNINGGKVRMETAKNKLQELKKADTGIKTANSRKKFLTTELSEWHHLREKCSKDGLRALEIDSVAPVITGYANDLLHETFGPNYSVKLRTVDPDTGKEVLDIMIIDENGNEELLDVYSGGEKVWSLKTLRLAMTLISKEKNDKNFLSALSDEEDGALDAENACHFIKLYRAFMKSGGFDTCLYITHKPECVSMADHILHFDKGGITID